MFEIIPSGRRLKAMMDGENHPNIQDSNKARIHSFAIGARVCLFWILVALMTQHVQNGQETH
jgi:hypothetical protein